MFLFGGVRKSFLKDEEYSQDLVCNYCNKMNFKLITYGRYLHIFWIPIFALPKYYELICNHCKKKTLNEELSKNEIGRIKVHGIIYPTKTPFYYNLGCFGMILLHLFLFGGILSVATCGGESPKVEMVEEENSKLEEDLRNVSSAPSRSEDRHSYELKKDFEENDQILIDYKIKYYCTKNDSNLLVILSVKNFTLIDDDDQRKVVQFIRDHFKIKNEIKNLYLAIFDDKKLVVSASYYEESYGAEVVSVYRCVDEFYSNLEDDIKKIMDTMQFN